MTVCILGLGTAVPPGAIVQSEAAEMAIGYTCRTAEEAGRLRLLYRRSGVERRHSVLLVPGSDGAFHQTFYPPRADAADQGPGIQARMQAYETYAPTLAMAAARAALANSGVRAGDVTDLVSVSCTGFFAPGLDCCLIEALGLPRGVARVQVGFMGCQGALNGLRVAQGMLGRRPRGRVLLCAVELCSLHYAYGADPERVVANALFADGAAAAVLGDAEDATADRWRLRDSGSLLIPETRALMSWTIGDHGFIMGLSPRLPEAIRRELPGWLAGWLATQDLRMEDIRSVAVHPGGPRILTAVERSLGLGPEALRASREVLATYGNMSSPTILFVLERLRRQGAVTPALALAFGPGLAVEAVLFE